MMQLKGSDKVDSKKRTYKTKQIIIPAKYFLNCIANDKTVRYPVNIFLKYPNGGTCRSVHSGHELKDLCASKDIYQSSVICAVKTFRGFHVELMKDGYYTVEYTCMPERRHMDTLIRREVLQLYGLLYGSREK